MCTIADVGIPNGAAVIQVEAVHSRDSEEHVQMLAVRCWCAGCIAVLGIVASFILRFRHDSLKRLLPLDLSRRSVKADYLTFQVFHFARIVNRLGVSGIASHVDA